MRGSRHQQTCRRPRHPLRASSRLRTDARPTAGADAVVCINISSDLSATMQSAQNAARALEGELDVKVVDSRSITAGLGTQVLLAAEAAEGGASADEVVQLVEDLARRTHVVGALDTLDNLKKGGRIGGAQALVGSLLSIKPIVDISSGKVEEAGRARTRGKALQVVRDKVFDQGAVEHLSLAHGLAPEVDEMLDMLAERHARDEIRVVTIGPVIGTHGGPRIMGVSWLDACVLAFPGHAGRRFRSSAWRLRRWTRLASRPFRYASPVDSWRLVSGQSPDGHS